MPWRVVSTCTVDAGTGADATVTIHGQENFAISPGCNNQTSQLSENVQHSICDLLRRARVGDAPGSQPYHVYGASVQGLLPSAKPPKKEKTDRKAKKKDKTKHTLGFLHKNSSSSDSSDDESKHGGVAWACSSCSRQLHDATDVWALRCGHMFHAGCLDSACQTSLECPACTTQIKGLPDVCRLHPVRQQPHAAASRAAHSSGKSVVAGDQAALV